jgi:hypothetical protein
MVKTLFLFCFSGSKGCFVAVGTLHLNTGKGGGTDIAIAVHGICCMAILFR